MEWKKAGLMMKNGEPVYYTEVPFVVKLGETTGLKVKVTTITFAVSLNLSEVIGDWLQEYDFTVTAGDRICSFRQWRYCLFSLF